MDVSEANDVTSGEVRATMTTGEVARRLGLTLPQVRRRMAWGELEGTRVTASLEPRRDVNGNELRGHRRIYVDSVEAYERRLRERAAAGAPVSRNP